MTKRINEVSKRVFDNGMEYEVVTFDLVNSEKNVANGGKPIITNLREIFKIKKDGTRGMKLNNLNKRQREVFDGAR